MNPRIFSFKFLFLILLGMNNTGFSQSSEIIMNDHYYLTIKSDAEINLAIKLNDFPLFDGQVSGRIQMDIPCNLYLVSDKNVLSLVPTDNRSAQVTFGLMTYKKGSVTNDGSGKVVTVYSSENMKDGLDKLTKSFGPESEQTPTNIYFTYDSKGFDDRFSGPVLNEDELLSFAMELLEMARNKDYDAIYEASELKMHDFFRARGIDPIAQDPMPMVKPDLEFSFENGLAKYPEKEEIGFIPIADGVIAELVIKPNNESLFIFELDEDNKPEFYMPVYVAKVNGKIKIIR